jgi:hypothetical protein
MDPELVIADCVRRRAAALVPGDQRAARAAVGLALRCFSGGSSVAEACEAANRFLGSWSRHPSHRAAHALRAAS